MNSFRVDFSGQLSPAVEKIHQVGRIIKNKDSTSNTLKLQKEKQAPQPDAQHVERPAIKLDKQQICRIENSVILAKDYSRDH